MNVSTLKTALPKAGEAWLQAALDIGPRWGIETENEMVSFIAQMAHESNEFTRLVESFFYTDPKRLVQIWPTRFSLSPGSKKANPMNYIRDPQRLANFVYANRMGNGPMETGDGWRYRGRGPLQITGKHNYATFALDSGIDVLRQPDLLLLPVPGITSACWYWKVSNLDQYDDDDSAKAETKLINGGEHGLANRQMYLERLLTTMDTE